MKLRPLGMFILTAGFAVLIGDLTPVGAQTKEEKKAMRLALKNKLTMPETPTTPEKPAPPVVPPKPLVPPLNTKDPVALAKFIDTHIDKKLLEAKIPASGVCSDSEFLRRVYLDLTGVIPPADKAKAFLDSTDPNKRAKLIDELLDSPNFGKRLSDIWQAKLLTRDSNNRFVQREPFVKWLEESFNKNTPWDKFVYSIVTAAGPQDENPAVTFFLTNRAVDKLTDSVAQNFLGIQLQCAQCHNHPFTTWKQTEYWGMATFFSKVQPENPRNPKNGADNTKIGVNEGPGKTKGKDFFPESAKEVPAKFLGAEEPKLNPREPYRPSLGTWMTSPQNPYFAKAMVNRTWALMFGSGFVNPVDDMTPENIATHPELLDALSAQFAADGFDVKHMYRAICLSKSYQRTSKPLPENKNDDQLFSHMTVKVMSPEQLYDSIAQVTGASRAQPGRPMQAGKGGPTGPRDQFVNFFLAGSEKTNPTEYEAGIPQALRLMNNKLTANPALARGFAGSGDSPATVIEKMYLATVSRRPTQSELDNLTNYVKSNSATEAYGDILWALLNSSEFTMVK
jgi:hypothetical protein